MNRTIFSFALALLAGALPAGAKEVHLDCARTGQTVMVDADTDRRFLQMMWGEGVAEEFLNGDSYVSGPDSYGEKEKVTYVVTVEGDVITFGENRACLQSGTKHKCMDREIRNTLDAAKGELKYDNGEEIAVLRCQPAPPGRKF
jgi:hypothetical protein